MSLIKTLNLLVVLKELPRVKGLNETNEEIAA